MDIGGTFTDLVLLDEEGELITTKALSTPGELEVGVFDAVQNAAEQKGMTGEQLLAKVTAFGHGTTQATNAVIERTGARTGPAGDPRLWRHPRHSAIDGLHRRGAQRSAWLVLQAPPPATDRPAQSSAGDPRARGPCRPRACAH